MFSKKTKLGTCRDCGAEVSLDAKACPKCGRPSPSKGKQYGCGTLVLLLASVAIIGSICSSSQASAPAARPAPAAPPVAPSALPAVEVNVDRVRLDWSNGDMTISGTLVRTGEMRTPDVWVWAYFVHDTVLPGNSWSGSPVRVEAPFAAGRDTVRFTAKGFFHWWNNSSVPHDFRYWARVSASDQGPEHSQVPSGQRRYDTTGAIQVVR